MNRELLPRLLYEKTHVRLLETRWFACGALVLFYEPTAANAGAP